ncbi:UDP-glucose 4-epimerase GalE [Parasporobacterium paucivorans]|uniref:UDP-glucose 4-epimerase n=1 Tax=Parasporobacterium paucivorans DSM 15970 TaxID=1122934 RepID=A0A1M6JTA5_9FIRM|nr:UDP-glucose 4-epimerase GalE [Parasporobacterium paucivorans]SHJ49896.1 UDP-galactose 4-epimerase [Parasporobacterium paucivorans DSM 15970]
MTILVTGGAGYIGSHTCVELLNDGYEVIVLDNLSNSSKESINRVEEIAGKKLRFYKGDICSRTDLQRVFTENKIDAVIHFAGLKAVGESVEKPLEYYMNNITGTLVLCEVMREYGVKNMVFSSSATVYGNPKSVPIREDFPLSTTNPYGSTKLMIENILTDIQNADKQWNIILLRYFNPIGAHESGRIGEDPNGIPNNLLPYVAKVAVGKLPVVNVFGNDYDTKDGTGVRDYIHVVDLARGHIRAIGKLDENPGLKVYNLGTGTGYSVLEVIASFSKACGKEVPYRIAPRRPGDIGVCYADPEKAWKELGWKAEYSIGKMCEDTWRWQSKNPDGYATPCNTEK